MTTEELASNYADYKAELLSLQSRISHVKAALCQLQFQLHSSGCRISVASERDAVLVTVGIPRSDGTFAFSNYHRFIEEV